MQSTNTPVQTTTLNTSQNPYLKRTNKPLQVGDLLSTNDGEVMVFSYIDSNHVQVLFIETLTVATFTAANLRSGRVKDYASPSLYGVGFLGEGIHQFHINSELTKVGLLWRNALKRCYDTPIQASYSSTTVAPEFHNFQTFASFYFSQENRDLPELDLDKDLRPLLRGDEQIAPSYSARNCALIPAALNLKVSKLQRRLKQLKAARSVHPFHAVLPTGINFDKSHLNFRVSVNRELVGSRRTIGAALSLYEMANIEAFIAEVESYKEALSSEVLAEYCAYKERMLDQFQRRIKAPEAEMATV